MLSQKAVVSNCGRFLVNVSLCLCACSGFAQPTLSKDAIPVDADKTVRDLIVRLYDGRAVERAEAARRLGESGRQASAAVPFLAAMFADDVDLEWRSVDMLRPANGGGFVSTAPYLPAQTGNLSPGRHVSSTSPYMESVKALDIIDPAWKQGDAGKAILSGLLGLLGGEDIVVRRNAARKIDDLNVPDPSAFGRLTGFIQDHDSEVQVRIISALGKTGDVRAIEPLSKLASEESPFIVQNAMHALARIDDPQARNVLVEAFHQPDKYTRRAAFKALSARRDSGVMQLLLKALSDPDDEIRESAALLLRDAGDAAAVSALIKALEDQNVRVRLNAARSLIVLQDPAAYESVVSMLSAMIRGKIRYREWDRYDALELLSSIRDPRAEDALKPLSRDDDPLVREAARTDLAQMPHEMPLANILLFFAIGVAAVIAMVAAIVRRSGVSK